MANPDGRRDTEAPEPSIETRGASPEIVYLPESFDLGAFPSEEPVEPTGRYEFGDAIQVSVGVPDRRKPCELGERSEVSRP